MKYIGQAFSTYIMLQNGEELVLIDQHAAHERILYEKLKIKYESQENTTQLLLEPVVIQLQAYELDVIQSNEELFKRIGFIFEDFGNNSIIIRGIPYLIEGYSPKEIFLELTDRLQESVKPITTPIADEIIHTIACKAAIKANKKLDDREVFQLLSELSNAGRKYTCPHGRPTVVRLTKYEIEKMFKRIV
jgi:DNA mismatch repair protein MutL